MAQVTTAWALKKAFPELTLHIVSDAGHSSWEKGITKLLVQVNNNSLSSLTFADANMLIVGIGYGFVCGAIISFKEQFTQ